LDIAEAMEINSVKFRVVTLVVSNKIN